MNSIVLGTGPQLTVLGIFWTLQALYHLCTHDAGQIGVFSVGFLASSPAGITEDIDIRCPHREAVELLVLARATLHTLVVLGTELSRGHIETLVEEVRIPRGSHGYRLRKHGDIALIGSTMKRFTPPEELLDA